MTNEEAIKTLDAMWKMLTSAYDDIADSHVVAYTMAVDALKEQMDLQSTCNNLATDTISRQAAIDALCGECQGRCIPCEAYPCSEVRALENVPSAQPEPQWIPCSKRLPKKIEKDYWICTDEGWQCVCRWRKFPSMRGDFWAWNVMHPVVAWMPRPEPYREGD